MKIIRNVFWAVVGALVLSPRGSALAQTGGNGGTGGTGGNAGGGGVSFTLTNPFKGGDTLYEFIKTVINDIILPIGGVIVVIMIIYSGFLFVTAGGDTRKIADARKNFMWVVVGTAVLLGAWVIATVIENTINQLQA